MSETWGVDRAPENRLGVRLAEFAAVPLIFVDGELRLQYANGEARELFALDSPIGVFSLHDLVPGLRKLRSLDWGAPSNFDLVDEVSAAGIQLEARRPGGSFRVELSSRPVEVNGLVGRVIVIRDMTDQNASMASILRAHRELEEFNRISVGRELRMIELKREVNDLLNEQDRPPRYWIDD
ncbi:MAG: hypothetical protein H6807_01980 [Planctomycetes bacterium]|nr:hypothetical protein [Planctomycetota bacterium]